MSTRNIQFAARIWNFCQHTGLADGLSLLAWGKHGILALESKTKEDLPWSLPPSSTRIYRGGYG